MYDMTIEVEQREITEGVVYVGFALDNRDDPYWAIHVGTNVEEIKTQMAEGGIDTEQSFICKIPMPVIVNKSGRDIRVIDADISYVTQ